MNQTYSSNGTSTSTYTLTESSATSYGSWSMTETGADAMTTTLTGNSANGNYTQTQNGTDTYTITESGTISSGAYNLTLTGIDTVTATTTGNTIQGIFVETVIGNGTYTRTETGGTLGSGSGTSDFTLIEIGDQTSGETSQTEVGKDRYALLEQFENAASAGGVSTPGQLEYASFGAAFEAEDEDKTQFGNILGSGKSESEITKRFAQLLAQGRFADGVITQEELEFLKNLVNGKCIYFDDLSKRAQETLQQIAREYLENLDKLKVPLPQNGTNPNNKTIDKISDLTKKLSDDDFDTREKAQQDLTDLLQGGLWADPQLVAQILAMLADAVSKDPDNAELKRRAGRVIRSSFQYQLPLGPHINLLPSYLDKLPCGQRAGIIGILTP